MRKTFVLFILLLIFPLFAYAELSTNLNIVTVMNWESKRFMDRQTYVDADGNVVVPDDKGYATIKYTYKYRKLIKEEFLDENDHLVNSVDGYAYMVNLYTNNLQTGCEYYDVQGKLVNGPYGYARQVITYTGQYHQSTWNYDSEGNPVGAHRVSEYIQNKKKKLLVSDTWYDTEGNLTPGPDGYARVENKYQGRTKCGVTYIAADGSLFYSPKAGYARMETVYNGKKIISTHYYGKNDELTAGPEGYAYILYNYQKEYDTEKYYNADGTPYYNKMGVCGVGTIKKGAYHKIQFYYIDEDQQGPCLDGYSQTEIYTKTNGKITIQSYLDINGQPMIVESLGYFKVMNDYRNGKILKTQYFGTDGKPICSIDGYAVLQNTITNKMIVKTNYFDADGKPCYIDGLYNEIRFTWDNNLKTAESYWKDGEKTTGISGCHEIRYEYNGAGKENRSSFFDTDGNKTLCGDGYAILETEYNSAGGVMSKRYYGVDGKLVLTPGKEYAFIKTIPFRDLKHVGMPGEETEEENEGDEEQTEETDRRETEEFEDPDSVIVEYHGLDGKLMNIADGYAYIVREKNEAGLVISEKYYCANGEPAVMAAGYSGVQREYDDAGNIAVERYMGTNGEKTVRNDGYDEIRKTYNEKKQAVRFEYYLNGTMTDVPRSYAIMLREYGEEGQVVSESYYNENEEPVLSSSGYHKIIRTWADKNHPSSESWFDVDNQPLAPNDTYVKKEIIYNEAGNAIVEKYYNADGEMIPSRDGFDEIHKEYDENGLVVRLEYYLEGKLTRLPKGYAIIRREYGEDGFVAVESYFDENEEVAITDSGYHKIIRTWAGKDRPSSEAWFDADDQPITVNNNTYVRREKEYDEAGNVITERYYDANGEKILSNEGYDETRRVYDENKRPIRLEYYANGELTKVPQGYAIMLREYDENGLVADESYYNEEEEPVSSQSGYHRIVRTWRNKDQMTSEAWFDTDNQPTTLKDSYVRILYKYDEEGHLISEQYYDADGEKIPCKAGYDEIRWNKGEALYYLNGEEYIIQEENNSDPESRDDENAA